MTAQPDPSPPLRPGLLPALVQGAVRVLWLYVLPALLAAALLRFFVPALGSGFAGVVVRLAHGYPVPFLAAAFLVFSALAHYWRFHLPGGRYASRLAADVVPGERDPQVLKQWAQLAESLAAFSSRAMRVRLSRTVDTASVGTLDEHLAEARAAMQAGDRERAQRALDTARTLAAAALAGRARGQAIGTGVVLAAAAVAAFGFRARVAESYEVENRSMLPTLQPGDRIGASKLAYRGAQLPARGDVIVLRSAQVPGIGSAPVPKTLVKRVIGLPGDRIAMQGGVPVINGWPVPSCDAGQYMYVLPEGDGTTVGGRVHVEFLGGRAYVIVHSSLAPPMPEPYVVRPGEVFVLGDNRTGSFDSRAWNDGRGGGVPLGAIEGRVQWFLVGTHANGEADFGRFLTPLNTLQDHFHVEGINGASIEEGIGRCLLKRPQQVDPPPPSDTAQATRAERGPGT
jgi:signal peptidase I